MTYMRTEECLWMFVKFVSQKSICKAMLNFRNCMQHSLVLLLSPTPIIISSGKEKQQKSKHSPLSLSTEDLPLDLTFRFLSCPYKRPPSKTPIICVHTKPYREHHHAKTMNVPSSHWIWEETRGSPRFLCTARNLPEQLHQQCALQILCALFSSLNSH